MNLVVQSPFVPENVTAQGGNESLTVNWGWPSGLNAAGNPTFLGVQLFCARGQETQVFTPGAFGAVYITSAGMCPAIVSPMPSPGGYAGLDPSYLCSDLLPSTAASHRITGLQNGIPYGVGVAALDKLGNVSSISDVVYASPAPSPQQEGGGCAVAGWHGRPGVLGSLGWLGIGLLIVRRRRARG